LAFAASSTPIPESEQKQTLCDSRRARAGQMSLALEDWRSSFDVFYEGRFTRLLRWLRIFEPLMIITGIVQPLAAIPSISKLYFTHTQHASGQSLTTWFIFAVASLLWVSYGLLNRKPAIYVGNIIGLATNLLMVNGILLNAGWTY
jgi:MtN3 and saliva related transmembrane protein